MRIDQFGGNSRRLRARLDYKKHNGDYGRCCRQSTEGWRKQGKELVTTDEVRLNLIVKAPYPRIDHSAETPPVAGSAKREIPHLIRNSGQVFAAAELHPKPTNFISLESKQAKEGCQSPLSSCAKKAVLFSLVASSIGVARQTKNVEPAALLRVSGRVLDGISPKSKNGVPDAVLNGTKCVVVIPSLVGGTANASAGGVASCREAPDRWSGPAFIHFNGRGLRAHRTDLLVFILSDTGVRALRSGGLQIRAQKRAAAPLVSTTPVTTQVELTAESLTYESAAGVLSSSEASGFIRPEAALPPVSSDSARSALSRKMIK